jgi:hypothetical protein
VERAAKLLLAVSSRGFQGGGKDGQELPCFRQQSWIIGGTRVTHHLQPLDGLVGFLHYITQLGYEFLARSPSPGGAIVGIHARRAPEVLKPDNVRHRGIWQSANEHDRINRKAVSSGAKVWKFHAAMLCTRNATGPDAKILAIHSAATKAARLLTCPLPPAFVLFAYFLPPTFYLLLSTFYLLLSTFYFLLSTFYFLLSDLCSCTQFRDPAGGSGGSKWRKHWDFSMA